MHPNAKLTPAGRRILVERIASGRPAAHVAAEMGVARKTAYKWWCRWLAEGEASLRDRSSRPRRCPTQVPARIERRSDRLRRRRKLGPARIAAQLHMAPSTVYRVLCRLALNRLAWLDRPTGRVIRRSYEHPAPGDLIHIDIKKLGRIPPGGGWRAHGRGRDPYHGHSRVGYAFVHSAVDDHSRLAYSEVLADECAVTAIAFWRRARAWFDEHGVSGRAVLTDNGSCYRSNAFKRACLATGVRPLAAPGPTTPRPTARSSASTAPCSRSGPTSASTAARRLAPPPLRAGCTSTIITAATPPSAASLRSAVSPTSRMITPSRSDGATVSAPAPAAGGSLTQPPHRLPE